MRLVWLIILASVCGGPALWADELKALGGKSLSGDLIAITDAEVRFKSGAEISATPLSQVLEVFLREAKSGLAGKIIDVRLLDDTVLHCTAVAFQGADVELTLSSGLALKLPLTYLMSMTREAQNQALMRKWDDIVKQKVKRDRIVVLREGDLNALEGTLGEIDAKALTIQFRLEAGNVIPVLFDKLHGMIFYRTEVPSETPICKVYDTQGNGLAATKISYDGKTYQLATPFGAKLSLAGDAVARLDFNLGKLTYLSDLEPAKVVERSGAGLITRYRKDVNLDGEPILLDKAYAKGLSMHAHTELEYNLAGKYKEFKAILGVDTRVGTDSQVRVTVLCDGEKRFEAQREPGGIWKIRVNDKEDQVKGVYPLGLNVKEVQTLRIVVSSRNFLDLHDHATLAEARVSQ